MSIDVSCGCGFTLGRLDAVHAVVPNTAGANDKVELFCPLCGIELDVVLQKLGVLARSSGAQVEYMRWGKPGAAAARGVAIGRFRLEFPNLGIIEPHQICYPRVPAFQTEAGPLAVPALPVMHRYFDCVDVGQLARLRQQGQLGHVEGDEYVARIPLLGYDGDPAEVRLPLFSYAGKAGEERVIRDVNLRLWPDVPSTAWRHYLLGLSATAGPTPVLGPERRIRMFASGATAGFTELKSVQRGGEALVGRLGERPTWIAIELTDAGKVEAGAARAGGLFDVPAAQDRALGNNLNVGLDFGTSNTCVAFQIQGGKDKDIELVRPVAETDWSRYLVRAGSEPVIHAGPDLWPGRSGFGPSEDLFPSEILFRRTRGDQSLALGDLASWTYGVDFGIPVAGIEPAFAEAEHIISEFKWSEMLEGSVFHKHVAALQAQYLAAVLMNAVVRFAVHARAMPPEVYVRYSYPMAFRPADHIVLEKAIEQVAETLPRTTGLRWSFLPGASESEAAAQSNDDRKAVEVFLDMGGGSTDVAIRTKERDAKDWDNVYVTSVRYAGAALLAAYAGTRQSTCLAAGASVDQLRRKVRESTSATSVVKDARLFNPNRERARVNRTDHFYGYVVELAARMIAAGVIEGRFACSAAPGADDQDNEISVAIHLLGNGWRFKTTTTAADFKAALCSAIEIRTEALINDYLGGEHAHAKDRLAVLQTKTLTFTPGRSAKNVPHDKAAVAVGVLEPRRGAADKGELSSGILGWNTSVRVGGVKRALPWFARYDNNDATNKRNRPAGAEKAAPVKATLGPAKPAAAADGPGAWYVPFGESPTFDWRDTPPALPRDLTPVKELDPDLSESLGKLRLGCADAVPTWFKKGAFEVLLEELFRDALREKIEG